MGHFRLQSYEKIRVVGKGAFGNAVLYRRRADGLMCIIKVILLIISRNVKSICISNDDNVPFRR